MSGQVNTKSDPVYQKLAESIAQLPGHSNAMGREFLMALLKERGSDYFLNFMSEATNDLAVYGHLKYALRKEEKDLLRDLPGEDRRFFLKLLVAGGAGITGAVMTGQGAQDWRRRRDIEERKRRHTLESETVDVSGPAAQGALGATLIIATVDVWRSLPTQLERLASAVTDYQKQQFSGRGGR